MRKSAGLLLYRVRRGRLELLIAHMGGPLWARREQGAWSIIKGEYEAGEDPLCAARREFQEETGSPAPDPDTPALSLGELRQPSGKRVVAWALESDFDASAISSNTFAMEWPRGSGRMREFPEIDRAAWVDADDACRMLVAGQRPFVERLRTQLDSANQSAGDSPNQSAGDPARETHSTSVAP